MARHTHQYTIADVLLERLHRRNRESPPITRDELLRWAQLCELPTPEEIALFDSPCIEGPQIS